MWLRKERFHQSQSRRVPAYSSVTSWILFYSSYCIWLVALYLASCLQNNFQIWCLLSSILEFKSFVSQPLSYKNKLGKILYVVLVMTLLNTNGSIVSFGKKNVLFSRDPMRAWNARAKWVVFDTTCLWCRVAICLSLIEQLFWLSG